MNINANKNYIAYQNTISLIYLKAVRDVLGDIAIEIDNSLNKGFFTVPANKEEITEEQVEAIDKRMGELIETDLPITKKEYTKEEALRLCDENNIPVATNIATAEVLIHGLERGDLDWRNIVNPKNMR